MTVDLVERLAEGATAAIANEWPILEHGVARLRGITLELRVANGGEVVDGRCRVERATKPIRPDRPMTAGKD